MSDISALHSDSHFQYNCFINSIGQGHITLHVDLPKHFYELFEEQKIYIQQ